MPKAKYYFNTHSLKYERVIVPLRKQVLRVAGFLASAMVFSTVIVLIAYSYLDSPKEKQLKREISQLELQYEILQERMDEASLVLADLQNRDDNIYRVIFEADPIPATVRSAGYGGIDRYKSMDGYQSSKLLIETTRKLDKLTKQMYVQSKSFDEIVALAEDKTELLASIPAIQPLSNKQLNRMSSGFGYRIHPIYKTSIMHSGMDFTAPIGTPIYATGNGIVKLAEYNAGGYGNHVVISHGFGYETLYGHLNRIKVRPGQRVTRGDVIGELGNSGSSTGPHLHYEVIKSGNKVDPIRYFFNDLTPEEYDRLIQMATQSNQSFD